MRSAKTPRITDFGLARCETDGQLTASEAILGTPSYMAPEQAAGQMSAVGKASDIYAVGAILYACLTGRPPHQAENHQLTLMHVLESPIVPPSERVPSVPRDLESICLKCLARQADDRYATANELVADLDRFLTSRPVLARPRQWREKFVFWTRKNIAGIALFAALAATAVPILLAASTWNLDLAEDKSRESQRHLEFLENLLESEPGHSAAWLRHAEWTLKMGRANECLKDLQVAENTGSANPGLIALLRCQALVAKREWSEAFVQAQSAKNLNPHAPEPHYLLGKIRLATGEAQKALKSLNEAIRIQPDYIAAYRLRADAHADIGALAAARQDLELVKQLLGARDGKFNDPR